VTLAVSIDQLQCSRANFRLGPVSLEVQAGARVAIVGPSGSGKTTLLRCLAGLQTPDSGTMKVGDTVVDDGTTRLPPAARHLGLVFQDGALWPHMNALKHLRFSAPGLSKQDALALLERGGILAQAKKKPGAMSGGEAQRLGLLRALAPQPAVLLLDEPLRSVDVHQRDGLVLLLRSICDERNVTSILVTHDRDEALALADHLIVMRDGQLVEQGESIDLLEHPATAFTAAFLRGAACLSAKPTAARQFATVFGTFDAPNSVAATGNVDVRLVVFPGEVTADEHGDGPAAQILLTTPGDGDGIRLRVAVEDQILIARTASRPTSNTTHLRLTAAPRLLPWHNRAIRSATSSNPTAEDQS
jgi:iron(III) transport system ATP-binding protein